MTPQETVALYYDAWRDHQGDMSDVPLADDFCFTGPVASFDTATGYREMAHQAGAAITSFEVRRQFVDGNQVCSIIDWEMAMPGVGRMTSAELLEVRDGVIVRGELIYDAEALRHAMAAGRAFGCYLKDPHTPIAHAYGLMVLTLRGDRVAGLAGFADTSVFAAFGLPRTLRE